LDVFQTVNNHLDIPAENEDRDDSNEPLLNDFISTEEVIQSINYFKVGKSAGPDKVLGEMLKTSNDEIKDFLVLLFKHLFRNGIFPKDWAKSNIIP